MAKRIIIEIDEGLLRVAEVTTSVTSVKFSRIFTIPLNEGEALSKQTDSIRLALNAQGISKGDVDIIVNRRSVEIREMSTPPVPNAELPELLRFVARNEFATLTDQWPFDFVPFSEDETVERKVLATALRGSQHSEIVKLVDSLGLKLRRLLLRTFCQAAAVEGQLAENGITLFAQRSGKTLDVLILKDGMVRSTRSVLLGGSDAAELANEAVVEIERTALLTPKTLEADTIERVVLIGPNAADPVLKQRLGKIAPVKILSDSDLRQSQLSLPSQTTEPIENSVALLGAALSLIDPKRVQVDFNNPRKVEVKQFDKKRMLLWAALSAAVLLFLVGFGWYLANSEKQAIARLTQELKTIKTATEPVNQASASQRIAEVAAIDVWNAERINWLEEFSEMSRRLETGDDVVLNSVNARISQEGRGAQGSQRQSLATVSLVGNVRTIFAKAALENSLAERPYYVPPFKINDDSKNSDYPYKIEGPITKHIDVFESTRAVQEAAAKRALERLQRDTQKLSETTSPE
jgi:hypothetical protein